MELMLPREKKTLETKKKIVDAAGRLIKQYDFRYLTVKNVCEEAGVAYGSFYHHFGTKENVVYEYCRGLFERMLEANPPPENAVGWNYIRGIIWSFLVYAKFCEQMGKEIIRYIYENCPDDLFYAEHFDALVRERIRQAYEDGLVELRGHPERLANIGDDVAVAYKGVVMCWFGGMDFESHRGRLCTGMEHVIHQMLGGFRSEKYHELSQSTGGFVMVTDDDEFDRVFRLIPELETAEDTQ